eukprot:2386572-Lingulodinium_polyedra.AAC.1
MPRYNRASKHALRRKRHHRTLIKNKTATAIATGSPPHDETNAGGPLADARPAFAVSRHPWANCKPR